MPQAKAAGSQRWRGDCLIWQTHPKGESKRKQKVVLAGSSGSGDTPLMVNSLGGRIHVRWDRGAAATPQSELVCFAEFLATTGVFMRWVSDCPPSYRSGNAPDRRDVLGTLTLRLPVSTWEWFKGGIRPEHFVISGLGKQLIPSPTPTANHTIRAQTRHLVFRRPLWVVELVASETGRSLRVGSNGYCLH